MSKIRAFEIDLIFLNLDSEGHQGMAATSWAQAVIRRARSINSPGNKPPLLSIWDATWMFTWFLFVWASVLIFLVYKPPMAHIKIHTDTHKQKQTNTCVYIIMLYIVLLCVINGRRESLRIGFDWRKPAWKRCLTWMDIALADKQNNPVKTTNKHPNKQKQLQLPYLMQIQQYSHTHTIGTDKTAKGNSWKSSRQKTKVTGGI